MSRTAEQVQAETMNYMWATLLAMVAGVAVIWFIAWLGYRAGTLGAYRQLTTGQAAVISYTVPGSGVCRAVLVDGKRHGEVCEGEGK